MKELVLVLVIFATGISASSYPGYNPPGYIQAICEYGCNSQYSGVVCGSNYKTYANLCDLKCDRNYPTGSITKLYDGPCQSPYGPNPPPVPDYPPYPVYPVYPDPVPVPVPVNPYNPYPPYYPYSPYGSGLTSSGH